MDVEPLSRILIAAFLSLPIGLDRELRGKAAGLRTLVVVAASCAALGQVSLLAAAPAGDGTRIAAQVVTGIGFLGAGVIFAAGNRVFGLTTAASVFSCAAVGLCAGLGEETLAAGLVGVTTLFLWPVNQATESLVNRYAHKDRVLRVVADDLDALARVRARIADGGVDVRELHLEPFGDRVAARASIRGTRGTFHKLVADVQRVEGVVFVAGDDAAGD